mmetsp:Transcript_27101/g.35354  ORF Transcript_27101/g.35354 Transcript_27101/m.35354 type:complete len:225 (-) Transcript_27101:25-699(-)
MQVLVVQCSTIPIIAVEQMHTDPGRFGESLAPARTHGCGVIIGRPIGQTRPGPVHHQARNLGHAFIGGLFANDLFVAITGVGELALIFAPCSLIDHTTKAVGELRGFDPVQDHLGNRELALHAFATGLEIQRLCKAGKILIALGLGNCVQPGFGELNFGWLHLLGRPGEVEEIVQPARRHSAECRLLTFEQSVQTSFRIYIFRGSQGGGEYGSYSQNFHQGIPT